LDVNVAVSKKFEIDVGQFDRTFRGEQIAVEELTLDGSGFVSNLY
jgi:hypothetical protein